jgi:pimeloyl-ACP methyl ester carboxylesterase
MSFFLRIALISSVFIFSSAVLAQEKIPRFEKSDCTFATNPPPDGFKLECGHLVVPQDRRKPDGQKLRLAVAVLRTTSPSNKPPLVMLHGGPSGPGAVAAGMMGVAAGIAKRVQRDVVMYDQRGAGLSEPTSFCAKVTPNTEKLLNARGQKERQEVFNAAARACVAEMRSNGLDPGMFNSKVNVADLIDLRKALGISQWDVAGVSYGARLAQEAMRSDPKGVRSVILHSPAIVGGGAESDMPLSHQRVIEKVFAACAAQTSCAAAFPTLGQDFYDVYSSLNATPIDVVDRRSSGNVTIRFDGDRFLRSVYGGFAGRLTRLPLIINELKRGDRERVAKLLVAGFGGGTGSNTLTNLVGCYDGYGPAYFKRSAIIEKQVRPEFRIFVNDLAECPIWHSQFAPSRDHLVIKSDIPTLILTMEFDDRTTTDHGKMIASGLKHGYLIELPGLTHGQPPAGCAQDIMVEFLDDPNRKPDTTCIASMPKPAFELKTLEVPMLTFSIANADGANSAFAGKWEATFPNAPAPVKFDLKINSSTVTGSVVGARTVDVFDGKVDSDTLSFKFKSPDGARTISITGKLTGDEIAFTRDVVVQPGGTPGGAFIYGASGPRQFTAKRVE